MTGSENRGLPVHVNEWYGLDGILIFIFEVPQKLILVYDLSKDSRVILPPVDTQIRSDQISCSVVYDSL